ncbi:hypothetical protein niasHT_023672 [Heterodera trifolii]|uniref:Uncharacterized protein n=1 Tax=Heterodera trifolii TaxID=157864 RepID=A0ABD2JUW9_9BILA
MLHPSTHCARKISRKQYSNAPDGAEECGGNADALLRKASRKLSQLSELGDFQQRCNTATSRRRCSSTESLLAALNGPGSVVSAGADSSTASHRSSTDDLTVLDCSNLSLGQLPIELLTEHSEEIEHLILDENELDEQALEDIPRLDKLETLSLNGNQIKNIGVFLQYLKRKCPNLKFLSLIGNPGWPHPILNNNLQLYRTYALSAVRLFPSLQFLDTARVSSPASIAILGDQCQQRHHQQQNADNKKEGTTAAAASVPVRAGRTASSGAAATSLATVANACRLF